MATHLSITMPQPVNGKNAKPVKPLQIGNSPAISKSFKASSWLIPISSAFRRSTDASSSADPSSGDAAIDAAVTAARTAQVAWRAVPVAERLSKVGAFLDALLAMNQEVVPEIAQQMGRPVRYGGEFGGVENAPAT